MTYYLVNVHFPGSAREYAYLSDDESIVAGDQVMVPAGPDNEEQSVTVVSAYAVTEENAPYPVDKMKRVVRKLPVSVDPIVEEAFRQKIKDWTDWEAQQCCAPPEEFGTYRDLVLQGYEKDWPEALEALAYASYGGNNVFPEDWNLSEKCFLRLIEISEDPSPYWYNSLGYIYYYGRTTNHEPQYEKAYQYFSIGGIHGIFESLYKMADMLVAGKGVPKNVQAAAKMVLAVYKENRTLFEEGNMTCQFADAALRLGGLHERGDGVEKDPEAAYSLYLQAQYAIRERMKAADHFGDKKVAGRIEEALARAKAALPEDFFQNSLQSEVPNLIGALLQDSEGLDMAVFERDGQCYLLARRADGNEDGEVRKMLLMLPRMNLCTLTDTVIMRIDEPEDVLRFTKEDSVFVTNIRLSEEDGFWYFRYMDHPVIAVKCKGFSFEL